MYNDGKAYKVADDECVDLHREYKKFRTNGQADPKQLKAQKKANLPRELREFQGEPAGNLQFHRQGLAEV
jgi:hypothetical protein